MMGDKLRDLRIERGLAQRELADALGVHHTYISKIERGKARPGMQFVRNAARILGVCVDDLMRGPTVTRRDSGLLAIVHGHDVLTDAQAIDLAHEILRVTTYSTDAPCRQCDRPRAWVQSVFCGACIAQNLREDLLLDGPLCDKCESALRYDGPLCAGCLAAMEGR